MAAENAPIGEVPPAPSGEQVDSDEVRRKALLRLGVAGVVTAAALAGLWWLDQSGGKKPESARPSPAPSPIVSAPMQERAPPQAIASETDTEESIPDESALDASVSEAEVQPAPPQPPAATAKPSLPRTPREAPPPPRVSNTPARALTAPTTAPAAPRPPRPASELGEPYLLRVGIFSDPERARELVERLNRQGIHAHMETRVHLGPFANRQEAEKAQADLRRLGLQGVLTPAAAMK